MMVTMQDMTPIEDLDRQRSEFLSTVSHETIAPLASIKGCATTALETASVLQPAVAQQFFGIIDMQIDQLSELTDSMLDVAQIETGSLSVFPEPSDLAVIVDQARRAVAFKIATGEIEEQYVDGSLRPMTWEERQDAAKTLNQKRSRSSSISFQEIYLPSPYPLLAVGFIHARPTRLPHVFPH